MDRSTSDEVVKTKKDHPLNYFNTKYKECNQGKATFERRKKEYFT